MKNYLNNARIISVIIFTFYLIMLAFKFSYAEVNVNAKKQIDKLMNDLVTYVENKDNSKNNFSYKNQIVKYLNLDFMARATSGKYWKTASKKQKEKYKELLFLKIMHSINLHTKKLKEIDFVHKKIEKRGKKLIYVRGILKNKDSPEINIIWKMYSKDLSIIDLQIEKISLIKTQKSETINLLRKFKGNFEDFLNNFKIKNDNI